METKYATYKLAPKGALMKTNGPLSTLKLKPIDFIILPKITPLNANIKIISKTKERSNTIELF